MTDIDRFRLALFAAIDWGRLGTFLARRGAGANEAGRLAHA